MLRLVAQLVLPDKVVRPKHRELEVLRFGYGLRALGHEVKPGEAGVTDLPKKSVLDLFADVSVCLVGPLEVGAVGLLQADNIRLFAKLVGRFSVVEVVQAVVQSPQGVIALCCQQIGTRASEQQLIGSCMRLFAPAQAVHQNGRGHSFSQARPTRRRIFQVQQLCFGGLVLRGAGDIGAQHGLPCRVAGNLARHGAQIHLG